MMYALVVLLGILINTASYIIFVSGTVRSSRTINTLLLESVLGSTLRSAYLKLTVKSWADMLL